MKAMKKVLVFVLTMTLLVSMFVLPAAAEIPADGVLATGNASLDISVLKEAAPGSKLVFEYLFATGASGDVGWGVGGICFDSWAIDDKTFEIVIPAGSERGTTLTAEFDLDAVLAKGASEINVNMYNGIDTYTVKLVQPEIVPSADPVPTTGDTAPVVAIALIAVVALCGMVVVNRKKAFR